MGTDKIKIGRFSVLAFFCLMIITGCLAGIVFYISIPNLPVGNWRFFAKPESKATKIITQTFPDIYVHDIDGNIYACRDQNVCIQVVESLSQVSRTCGSVYSIAPPAPGKVIDSLKYRSCAVDGWVDVHYILLDDGSIWKWTTGWSSFGAEIVVLTCMISGALIGAIFSLIVLILKRRRLKRQRAVQTPFNGINFRLGKKRLFIQCGLDMPFAKIA